MTFFFGPKQTLSKLSIIESSRITNTRNKYLGQVLQSAPLKEIFARERAGSLNYKYIAIDPATTAKITMTFEIIITPDPLVVVGVETTDELITTDGVEAGKAAEEETGATEEEGRALDDAAACKAELEPPRTKLGL